MKISNLYIIIFSLFLLYGCGGGGGNSSSGNSGTGNSSSSSTPTNSAPKVTITGGTAMESNVSGLLIANATDTDGTIASYSWSTDSTTALTLTDVNKSQVILLASAVDQDMLVTVSVTVTDDKGATAKASTQVTVKSISNSLKISGQVINSVPVANVQVEARIGGEIFATKTNAQGEYTLSIGTVPALLTHTVELVAFSDIQPTLKLVSQLNSVERLVEEAGANKILDATENAGTNITSVTTAEAALLHKPDPTSIEIAAITSETQLQQIRFIVDTNKKLQRAALLQIIATDKRFSLPAETKSTFDFLLDEPQVLAMFAKLEKEDPALLKVTLASMVNDARLWIPQEKLVGQYVIYSPEYAYLMFFNDDATGELIAGNFKTAFKWKKLDQNISFEFPARIDTGIEEFGGRWFLTAASFSIEGDYGTRKAGSFRWYKLVVRDDGTESSRRAEDAQVQMLPLSSALKVDAKHMLGEWVGGKGYDAAIYNFNTDSDLVTTTLRSPVEIDHPTWSQIENRVQWVNKEGVTEALYFLLDKGVGYSYIKISTLNGYVKNVSDGLLIKPQVNLALKKSDFLGLWTENYSSLRLMTNDGKYKVNIGAGIYPWEFIDGQNSWEVKSYGYRNIPWLPSCDLIVGAQVESGCKPFRVIHKVIAVDGERYYSIDTQITGFTEDYYAVVEHVKLPEVNRFDYWIIDDSAKVFYQKIGNIYKAWTFASNKLTISDQSIGYKLVDDSVDVALVNNTLHYVRDNIEKELRLIAITEDGMTVCEYSQGSQCTAGSEFLLSNKDPAAIKIKVNGGGNIAPNGMHTGSDVLMVGLFGNRVFFDIFPDVGYKIDSVTGCDGFISSPFYITGEIRTECIITANFIKAD